MARIYIPAQWRDLTGNVAEVELPGNTVRELVAALEQQFPGIAARACPAGELSPGLQVSVNGVFSTRGLRAKTEPTAEVHFLPAFGGG